MELRQLLYFREVAEREHVTEAAEHLHISQSSISFQIAKLEEELGVTLFDRVGRNVKLTQIGEVFLAHTRDALTALNYAKEKIEEYLDPENGTIKIGYPTSLARYFVPMAISAFRKALPNVSFQLRQGSYSFLIEKSI